MITAVHIVLVTVTVAALLLIGVLGGRHVKDARSFTTGGRAGGWMVCGIIMGTLVGGQSTVGTSQMAFSYGLSAWWFTIGTALGTLVLALALARPLRRHRAVTLNEVVAHEYGPVAERVGSVLSLLGIFISIVAQILASTALMTALFGLRGDCATFLSALLIVLFILFGGIQSAGIGGMVKVGLLYFSCMAAGYTVWRLAGGTSGLTASICRFFTDHGTLARHYSLESIDSIHQRYDNLLAHGTLKDLGGCMSLILGVLCTQTYAQAIWAARSHRAARQGALAAALLTPLIGAACTLVGLYMRSHYITADEASFVCGDTPTAAAMGVLADSSMAFPVFILHKLSPWMGGVIIGTLFVTILGGGSGLALGATTIVVRDIFSSSRDSLTLYRSTVLLIMGSATAAALLFRETLINELGFLSLGLRATALVFPLLCALAFPGRFRHGYAVASMLAGTAAMLTAHLMHWPLDPSLWGVGAGLIAMLPGWCRKANPPC